MEQVITLTTDFGSNDAYVAALKGVILSLNPRAIMVDLCHSIEPQDIFQGAFVLSTAYPYFPQGTIHIVVVDPGVGSQRRPVLLATLSAFFLAPDNGVLSYVLGKEPVGGKEGFPEIEEVEIGSPLQAFVLTNPRFWRHPVSTTFHGRDIFAPVAAHLSLGTPAAEFGERISHLLAFSLPRPEFRAGGEVVGHIVHIDHFGNLITDIRAGDLPARNIVSEVKGQRIAGISPSYEPGGKLLALVSSSEYLEIAARRSSAAKLLKAKVGDRVRVFPPQRSREGE